MQTMISVLIYYMRGVIDIVIKVVIIVKHGQQICLWRIDLRQQNNGSSSKYKTFVGHNTLKMKRFYVYQDSKDNNWKC